MWAATRVCFYLLVLLLAVSDAARAKDECPKGSDTEQVRCLADKISKAEKKLEDLYRAALAEISKHDPIDWRKDRAQLTKAEDAWKAYVLENCTYVGGQMGGSNEWVTNFALRCQLDETAKRIEFFRHPPQ